MSYVTGQKGNTGNRANSVCAKVLLQKIKEGDIQQQEASLIFAVWSAEKVPTTETLDYMLVC